MPNPTAITLPLEEVETLLAIAMRARWLLGDEDRAAIKLIDREVRQVRDMLDRGTVSC